MRVWGPLFLGVSLALLGCGQAAEEKESTVAQFDVPKLAPEREAFLKRFPIVNDSDEEGAPRDPVTGKAPFGVLIHMATQGRGNYCSAAHVSPGYVTANAHCIAEDDRNPENYFVVFYNKRNYKRYERVFRFEYVGDPESDDVAVFRIHPEVAPHWDTIGGKPLNTSNEIRRAVPHDVILWAFNPFNPNHPDLYQKFNNHPGMRFTPKHCRAMRKEPTLIGVVGPVGAEERKVYIGNRKNSGMHWFVDECDKQPVKGNSGSLITDANDIRRMMGVFHWVVSGESPDYREFDHFEYTGTNGELRILTWDEVKAQSFFGVGLDFASIQKLAPFF